MPILGSTAFEKFSTVQSFVQSLLNDQAGNVYVMGGTPPKVDLVPYMSMAYRKIYQKLQSVGKESLIVDNTTFVITAVTAIDPTSQVVVNDGTTPQLPTDLVEPLNLWERRSGSNDQFVPMSDMTGKGGLPSVVQTSVLNWWEWRTDGLYFIGATQDQQVRMRYVKVLPDPVDSTSSVLIRNASNAIAYFTAALASMARGSPLAEKYDAAGEDALGELIRGFALRAQKTGHRRRPYGRRSGFAWW